MRLPCLGGARPLAPGEAPSQRTRIHDCRGPDWHHFASHPPGPVLPVQLREPRVLPGWERVGRRQSRDFPPPTHPGLRPLACCPSRPLDLRASRGLQGPPTAPGALQPGLPSLSTPKWQLLLGSCSQQLPSGWNHSRSPGPCPRPHRADRGVLLPATAAGRGSAGERARRPGERRARIILTLGRRMGGTLVDHVPGNSRNPSAKVGSSAVSRVLWLLARGRLLRLWEHVSWVPGR